MKSLEEVKKIIGSVKGELAGKFNVKEIWIFGSYVRGEEDNASDLDVLVEFAEPIGLLKFIELEEYLAKLVGKKVDLVSVKALKPRIGRRILSERVSV